MVLSFVTPLLMKYLSSWIHGVEFRDTAVDEVLEQLDSCVTHVLDAHVPSEAHSRSLRHHFPWYNEEVNNERC